MIQKVLLPKLGQTVETAVIETWRVKEGDPVKKGDVLCEITTDKATLEVESYVKGTLLKILGPTGQPLPVNSLIAVVGDPGEAIPADLLAGGVQADAPTAAPAAPAAATPAPAPTPSAPAPAREPAPVAAKPQPAPAPAVLDIPAASGRLFASPRARKLAAHEHVPLVALKGSGPNGRVVEKDVAVYADKVRQIGVTPLARKLAAERGVDVLALAAEGKKVTRDDVVAAQPVTAPAAVTRVMPRAGKVGLTPMRRIIAERMCQSKRDIPCYYLHMDADMTDLMEARRRFNARGDLRVSINDYIVVACARALAEFPDVNSRWDGDGITYRGECNVSFAVALDAGLIVPVVKNIERKTLPQVAEDSRTLIEKARGKKLLPAEYEGGCMTISNLGTFGVKHFIPIVNPGESCILGLGMIEDRVVVRQGGIHIRKVMTMTLAADHRLVDGAVGAKFLERIRDLLENPTQLEK
ncbi:MAG TPA: dihydrolipoamide acetyltransferase family protein [Phycisphaerae bacterium]|nr:2-oxo acid dehydrogenase subunit E2 [Phycisphaerae bacterium]HOI56236.1 dihydrolipoamide acetyltransferase family protein [Phycisphaerae bacterium]